MPESASSTPVAKERLFTPAATPAEQPASEPAGKLDLDGILTTKTGAIYFGQIKEEESGRVIVTVPGGDGKVRTVRPISRDQVASTKELAKVELLKLAKIGPHVLAKSDVERVVPNSTQPAPTADTKPADDKPADAAAETV